MIIKMLVMNSVVENRDGGNLNNYDALPDVPPAIGDFRNNL
jgi:hypothetical protein